MSAPTADLDLFAGPGGWDEGVRALGVRPVGVEWGEDACATARAAGHVRVLQDVAMADPRAFWRAHLPSYVDRFPPANPPLRLQIASPPCQGFSPAGKGQAKRDAQVLLHWLTALAESVNPLEHIDQVLAILHDEMDDERSILTLEPLRWALHLGPRFIALEQVGKVLPLWEAIGAVLERVGYSVAVGRLSAEQYGVPQARRRAILVARDASATAEMGDAALPIATHTRLNTRAALGGRYADDWLEPFVTMADALAPAPIVAAVPGDTSWAHRRPSPTIVGSFAPHVVAAPGWRKAGDGPRQNQPGSVLVTLEQAARLQSFPDGYPFQGSTASRWQQVGDAVPPLLARAIVAAVMGLEG